MPHFDTIIKNGRYFDGLASPSSIQNIGIKDGAILAVSSAALNESDCEHIIDAHNQWVMPGFIDTHTHYDAELIASPSLSESVRHGVTHVLVGSRSLSMICRDAEGASAIFTRGETVPREKGITILQTSKN